MGIAAGGSTGGGHSLGLKTNGTIVAWGINYYGECNVPEPNQNFVAVAAGGGHHSLGLKSNGKIVAWGRNVEGQCNVPEPNADFVSIAGGGAELMYSTWGHSMGLKDDGTIVAWGGNDWGQCEVPAPNADFVSLAAGGSHSLGLRSDGTIVAWGRNYEGQCNVPEPNANFVAIAAGLMHSLGCRADGTIVAWGANHHGQCDILALANVVAMAAGYWHSVAVRRSGVSSVTLSAFNATAMREGISLVWSTSFESDHLGFRVHRATRADGDYVRVSDLIEPPGPYRYLDTEVRPGATYFYRLEAADRNGGSEFYGPVFATAPAGAGSPRLMLSQNQPNPFVAERGGTAIGFTLGEPAQAKLRIFDSAGRLVRMLVDEPLDAGPHVVMWDGRNDGGAEAGSGIYYYRLDAAGDTEVKMLVKIR